MGNIKSFCCRDSPTIDDDLDERARIINDQYPSTTSLDNSLNSNQDDISYGSINNGTIGGKTVEQSALDKIYQKMAANVIDVAPGESMIIQPAEFIERQKAYHARLNQIKTPLPMRSSNNRMAKHVGGSTIDTTTRVNTSISSIGGSGTNWTKTGNQHNNTNATASNGHISGSNIILTTTASGNLPQHLSRSQERRRIEYEPISTDDIQLINEISDRTIQAIRGLRINSQEEVVTHFQP